MAPDDRGARDQTVEQPTNPEHWLDLNRAAWDERVGVHLTSDFYDTDSFVERWHSLPIKPEIRDGLYLE